ncbi:hypothetical protein VaNZ11_006357, partial [Volvox africanus]
RVSYGQTVAKRTRTLVLINCSDEALGMRLQRMVPLAQRIAAPTGTGICLLRHSSHFDFSRLSLFAISVLKGPTEFVATTSSATRAELLNRSMASVLSKRMNWDEIKNLVHRGKTTDVEALGVLGRCEADLMAYRDHRAKILQKYASVTDELRGRLFGAPLVVTQDGKLVVAASDPTSTKRHILVMANEFPYYVDPEIAHLNIWCSNGPLSDETVEHLIAERLPSETEEYVWFINPLQYQSIRAIWHCHVFVRNLKSTARVGKPGEAELWD